MAHRGRFCVAGLFLLLAFACADDTPGTGATDTTAAAQPATTTLPPATTTVAVATTAAAPAPTPPTTQATTTTLPPPEILFLPDGLGFVSFGQAPADVIAPAEAIWGPPIQDTNLQPSDFDCPGTQHRKVTWDTQGGTIQLLFSDARPFSVGGEVVFMGYLYLSPGGVPLTPGPPASIDVGVTTADALAVWPAATVLTSEFTSEDIFLYTPGFDTGLVLLANVSGLTDADRLLTVHGGRGCLGDEPGGD